jgi:hypothetical protein
VAGTPRGIENVKPWFQWNNASMNRRDINYHLHPDDIIEMKGVNDSMKMYNILC